MPPGALLVCTASTSTKAFLKSYEPVQTLINAIPSANDQKGILDLQARIQAEQGMLQTDSTKLNLLYQAAQAQELARRQSAFEQVVAGVGNLRTLPALRLP